ncbi:MAG: CsbD family protein [Rhodobacteraceae bacterium]|nr:CsbD family protein [Paracoccaceae bacterium]
MNWDRIEGTWKQYKGKALETWADLTDDEFDRVAGKREQMIGLVQQKYGKAKDEAEREVDSWFAKL